MPPKKTSRSSQSGPPKPRSSKPRSSGSRSSAPRTAKSFPVKKSGARSGPASESTGRPSKSRKVFAVLGVILGGTLLVLIVMVGFLDGYGQKNRAQRSDAIVVLGARVRPDGQAGQGLKLRVLHAVRLYKKGYAPKIIMTGGVGDNPPSEARVSADLAVKNGVLREDIIEENKSTSTWENAANASGICKKHKWKSVLIVSDPFHLWRAQRNFTRSGMRASVSPVAAEQWRLQPARRLFWTAREAVLVARDWCLRRV